MQLSTITITRILPLLHALYILSQTPQDVFYAFVAASDEVSLAESGSLHEDGAESVTISPTLGAHEFPGRIPQMVVYFIITINSII